VDHSTFREKTSLSYELMPTVVWFSRLQPGADREAYEQWVEQVDYPGAARIPSIQSYRVLRVEGPCVGGPAEAFAYDYVEIATVSSLPAYLRDLEEHPAAQEIIGQITRYAQSVGSAWGEPVPPK